MQKLRQLQQQQRLNNTVSQVHDSAPPVSQGQGVGLGRAQRGRKRPSAMELRTRKDLAELVNPPGTEMYIPNCDNIAHLRATVTPSEGLWAGALFSFDVLIPAFYPYDPPQVVCVTPVYHPNIDEEGRISLNILGRDWMPGLDCLSRQYCTVFCSCLRAQSLICC
eukprot:TRINITY_DN15299_c0_g1_i1.p1 TRINITY_DN15299_c0_g1~~TRINITY_DN15299_c0_g1_i1.p1  ORF type:complete len:165 (-),score=7.64 TRINITY_DN15299_c0_g1_i1:133-627(-)